MAMTQVFSWRLSNNHQDVRTQAVKVSRLHRNKACLFLLIHTRCDCVCCCVCLWCLFSDGHCVVFTVTACILWHVQGPQETARLHPCLRQYRFLAPISRVKVVPGGFKWTMNDFKKEQRCSRLKKTHLHKHEHTNTHTHTHAHTWSSAHLMNADLL